MLRELINHLNHLKNNQNNINDKNKDTFNGKIVFLVTFRINT